MAIDPIPDLLNFIDQRLYSMLQMPDAWGAPEAVELQVLLLLEVRLKAKGADDEAVSHVQKRYYHFLAQHLPGPPCSLAERLGLGFSANDQFIQLLKSFAQSEYTRGMATTPLPKRDQSEAKHYQIEA